jgi:hypothetical protein
MAGGLFKLDEVSGGTAMYNAVTSMIRTVVALLIYVSVKAGWSSGQSLVSDFMLVFAYEIIFQSLVVFPSCFHSKTSDGTKFTSIAIGICINVCLYLFFLIMLILEIAECSTYDPGQWEEFAECRKNILLLGENANFNACLGEKTWSTYVFQQCANDPSEFGSVGGWIFYAFMILYSVLIFTDSGIKLFQLRKRHREHENKKV